MPDRSDLVKTICPVRLKIEGIDEEGNIKWFNCFHNFIDFPLVFPLPMHWYCFSHRLHQKNFLPQKYNRNDLSELFEIFFDGDSCQIVKISVFKQQCRVTTFLGQYLNHGLVQFIEIFIGIIVRIQHLFISSSVFPPAPFTAIVSAVCILSGEIRIFLFSPFSILPETHPRQTDFVYPLMWLRNWCLHSHFANPPALYRKT